MKKYCICMIMLTFMAGMPVGCSSAQESPNETTQEVVTVQKSISPENMEVEHTMEDFMEAYFAGDEDAIRQYLATSYEQEVEVYGDPEHADEVIINFIQGINYNLEGDIGEECDMAAEFMAPGEDSYTYLTVGFVREESGWKVSSYGLEK